MNNLPQTQEIAKKAKVTRSMNFEYTNKETGKIYKLKMIPGKTFDDSQFIFTNSEGKSVAVTFLDLLAYKESWDKEKQPEG
jgi:hypothetical protein